MADRNVLGSELEPCGTDPVTGFFRDGCCNTGPGDLGSHTICAVVTSEFLAHQRSIGNDLTMPMPEFSFPGLVPGDRWCVTAANWLRAHRDGAAAPVVLASTHERALEIVPLEVLRRYSVDVPADAGSLEDLPNRTAGGASPRKNAPPHAVRHVVDETNPVLAFGQGAVPLSVLDLAPVPAGGTAAGALRATIEAAGHAERLGFRRFWVAEHHNMPGVASSAPPVLIGHIADATSAIRVGSGGVMLPNHVSLVVAEQFGMLEALHPGRIDLGIGRAPGTDQVTAAALRRSPEALSADDFPGQLLDLLGFFTGSWPDGHPFAQITAVPGRGNQPAIWLLGSSGYSAQVAGLLGLPFAFAHHFSPASTLPALALYRSQFRPSAVLGRPYAMVAAAVICADTDDRARWLAGPSALSFLRLRQGRPGPLPTPEEAAGYPYTDLDRAVVRDRQSAAIVGSPDSVRDGLAELLRSTAADELMITTMVHDPADRLRSFDLLAGVARTSGLPDPSGPDGATARRPDMDFRG